MITASAKDFGYTEQAHQGWLYLHVPIVSSARNRRSGGGYMVACEILVSGELAEPANQIVCVRVCAVGVLSC